MQSPQTSCWPPPAQAASLAQSLSAQSTAASPSSSMPFSQLSRGPPELEHSGSVACAHMSATHVSVVHMSPSSHSASMAQGVQPRVVVLPQTPAVQVATVHGLPSSWQSAAVVHALHAGSAVELQAPAAQTSVVHALP